MKPTFESERSPARGYSHLRLINQLKDPLEERRSHAAKSLGAIAEEKHQVIPALFGALNDESPKVRWVVMESLRELGPLSVEFLPALTSVMKDSAGKVRWRAAEALGEMGSHEAVPALVDALGDDQHWVRWHAQEALRRITDDEERPEILSDALKNSNPRVRAYAAELLGKTVAPTRRIVHALMSVLQRDVDFETRRNAADALGKLGCGYKDVIPILVKALCDERENVQAACIRSLARVLHHSHPTVISPLLNIVHKGSPCLRGLASTALGQIGFASRETLSALLGELNTNPSNVASWRALLHLIANKKCRADILVSDFTKANLERAVLESIAQGRLPTIGIKVWREGSKIQFPSNETPYPWEDKGVFHSWSSHVIQIPNALRDVNQICIHGDWFAGVHLIGITQLILHSREIAPPPAVIEGKEVGFVIQSGGNLIELDKMRVLKSPFRTNRIDFLYGKDLRMIQYLMLAGMSSQLSTSERTTQETTSSKVWDKFSREMRDLLMAHGLRRLATEEWFCHDGWRSSRYHIRYERRYADIRPGIEKLGEVIQSDGSQKLKDLAANLVHPLLDELHDSICYEGLKTYPHSVVGAIINARLGHNLSKFAERVMEELGNKKETLHHGRTAVSCD